MLHHLHWIYQNSQWYLLLSHLILENNFNLKLILCIYQLIAVLLSYYLLEKGVRIFSWINILLYFFSDVLMYIQFDNILFLFLIFYRDHLLFSLDNLVKREHFCVFVYIFHHLESVSILFLCLQSMGLFNF